MRGALIMPTLLTIEPETKPILVNHTSNLILNIDAVPAEGELYISYQDCKRIIAGKFTSVKKYINYVIEHNLSNLGLPTNPWLAYRGQYEGAENFLGGSASNHSKSSQTKTNMRYQAYIQEKKENPNVRYAGRKKKSEEQETVSVKSAIKPIKEPTTNKKNSQSSASMIDICTFLTSRNMTDVLKVICEHENMNLNDARTITKFLVDRYTK